MYIYHIGLIIPVATMLVLGRRQSGSLFPLSALSATEHKSRSNISPGLAPSWIPVSPPLFPLFRQNLLVFRGWLGHGVG